MIDIILALSLSLVFVSIITYTSFESRRIFDAAIGRRRLLDTYDLHAADFVGMLPYQKKIASYTIGSTTSAVTIDAGARWYGNDRIETDIHISDGKYDEEFVAVRTYPYLDAAESAGVPLCNPDPGNNHSVGLYEYPLIQSLEKLKITPISLPVDPSIPLTDIVVRNGRAYISADSNVVNDPDLYVLDDIDTQPKLVSALNTGPGLVAITQAGEYVYGAAPSTAGQLHIIDIKNPPNPVLAKKYLLPLPLASTSPTKGSSIFYNKGAVYLGTEKWGGDEFNIIDVSNPILPYKKSGLEIGSKVNGIFFDKNIGYIAASDIYQLRVINVTNQIPTVMQTFSPSGFERQEGKFVGRFEDALYLGRTSGGFNITQDHELFTWASSTDMNTYRSVDNSGGVYGIVGGRGYTFVITRMLDHELMVFDLSTTSLPYSYPLPVQPQSITCDGDKIYILAKTAPVIYSVGFTN